MWPILSAPNNTYLIRTTTGTRAASLTTPAAELQYMVAPQYYADSSRLRVPRMPTWRTQHKLPGDTGRGRGLLELRWRGSGG